MTDLNVDEDLVPISRLGAGSKYVRAVVETGRPKVVTEGGVGVAVILDVETYQSMRAEGAARAALHDLETALAEADEGNLVDQATVLAGVRDRLGGQVPNEIRRELGAR
jgi:prevent-host-death family protein